MKKLIYTIISVLGLTLIDSCGINDDRESKVNDYFQQKVTSESQGAIKLESFKKTNGYDQEVMGMKIYVLEWNADISTQQEIWKGGDAFVGYWQSFSVMTKKPAFWDAFIAGSPKHFGAGANIRLTGDSKLQKTEQGWRVEQVTVKTYQILSEGSSSNSQNNTTPSTSNDSKNNNSVNQGQSIDNDGSEFIGQWQYKDANKSYKDESKNYSFLKITKATNGKINLQKGSKKNDKIHWGNIDGSVGNGINLNISNNKLIGQYRKYEGSAPDAYSDINISIELNDRNNLIYKSDYESFEATKISTASNQTQPTTQQQTSTEKLGTFTDTRDGRIYKTVQIGNQIWMAENLAYKTSNTLDKQGNSLAWCSGYPNNISDAKKYGYLYSIEAAKIACPTGWRLPTKAEWQTLINFLGGESIAGGKMKEAGTSHWSSPNSGANNESGFTALPGGYHNDGTGRYEGILENGTWWSSSANNSGGNWVMYLTSIESKANFMLDIDYAPSSSYSVRCIKK